MTDHPTNERNAIAKFTAGQAFSSPSASTIMLQGTASDVGKSLLTTALCRILAQDGYRVAPFKSQNMSLNSYVTPDGKEIGRAQGMQADACGIAATTDMNPILLKPSREMASQVVVHGKPYKELDARAYREQYLPHAEGVVKDALASLRADYDVVVIEGAGSPAEINLKDRDIVNMRLAAWADAPVILIADIDRGGVFASIVGTMEILEPHERDRVKGIIINKFRGDVTLLQSGLDWLEDKIHKPVLGVVPYLPNLALEDEDSASLDHKIATNSNNTMRVGSRLDIAVIRLPRISNFSDIDPLTHEPDVFIRYVTAHHDLGQPDAIILPGSKNTALDLQFLRESGLADSILNYVENGGRLIGICGGYQMLGHRLLDPDGIESSFQELLGLDLFPMETVFESEKRTVRVHGYAQNEFAESGFTEPGFAAPDTSKLPIQGYEIHMGVTTFTAPIIHPFRIKLQTARDEEAYFHHEGACSADGRVWGTYIHGILHNDELRLAWLNTIRAAKGLPIGETAIPFGAMREQSFDRLAEHFRTHVDMNHIYRIMNEGATSHEQTE
jgi:cobyric acid synthase CobQ